MRPNVEKCEKRHRALKFLWSPIVDLFSPAEALVNCDFLDRPITLPDNKYDEANRRCTRSF